MTEPLNVVILGLSMTSSWGNGHATVFRSLVRALTRRGHPVTFLERDVPWYAANRDMPNPPFGRTELYQSVDELKEKHEAAVRNADVVIVGSYVPDGVEVGRWVCATTEGVTAFYDIDTPITLSKLEQGDYEYLTPDLIPKYQLYLSFTGGPTLKRIEREYGSPMARPLYCCFDPEFYYPEAVAPIWDMGYMGTYSDDRQPRVDALLLEPARRWDDGRFVIAGPQYPANVDWPGNVRRIEHLPPSEHPWFYNRQRFTLNVTRDAMIRAGFSPSVRLFEAAACGTPIISDMWEGLNHFFEIGREILVANDADESLRHLRDMPDGQRVAIGLRARQRVLTQHTAAHRAAQLEAYVEDLLHARDSTRRPPTRVQTHRAAGARAAKQSISELGPWFHNLHLPDGTQTAPDHPLGDFPTVKWNQVADYLPQDLTGCNALDVGCNAGFYAFELARRGAHVLGIDGDDRYLAQARWATRQYDLEDQIEFRNMQVYELAHLREQFDLVLFMGVFYHLRYPLLGLDVVAEKVRKLMLFQSLTMPGMAVHEDTADQHIDHRQAMLEEGWPKMAFIEHRLAGDPTNWWAPNHAGVEAMLRSAGMQVIGRPAHEFYLCQPNASDIPVTRTWASAELLAATGRREVNDAPGDLTGIRRDRLRPRREPKSVQIAAPRPSESRPISSGVRR